MVYDEQGIDRRHDSVSIHVKLVDRILMWCSGTHDRQRYFVGILPGLEEPVFRECELRQLGNVLANLANIVVTATTKDQVGRVAAMHNIVTKATVHFIFGTLLSE